MTTLMQSFISEEMVLTVIKAVIDPELGINIVDLGLIYSVEIEEDGRITIHSPNNSRKPGIFSGKTMSKP